MAWRGGGSRCEGIGARIRTGQRETRCDSYERCLIRHLLFPRLVTYFSIRGDLDLDALAGDAGCAPSRRSGCASSFALCVGARSRRHVFAADRRLGAFERRGRSDRRLAQRPSASVMRLPRGDVAKLLAARTPSPCPRWPGRRLRIAVEVASASRAVAARIGACMASMILAPAVSAIWN